MTSPKSKSLKKIKNKAGSMNPVTPYLRHSKSEASTRSPKKKVLRSSANEATQIIKSHGLKLTTPRKAIVQLLMEHHGPFTMEELHSMIAAELRDETPDLATIYRTITRFEELALVSRCDFGDGTLRYELAHHDHHHHHMVCQSCRNVLALAPCHIDLEAFLPKDHGFSKLSHKLEFFGICPKCQKQEA